MLSGTVFSLFLAAFSFCSFPFPVVAASSLSAPSPISTPLAPAFTASPPTQGKVILVLIDALDVETFVSPEWTHLRRLASQGVVGLMNSRTASTPTSTVAAAAHLTLGARARAPAGNAAGHAANVDDVVNGIPAGLVYEATTGFRRPSSGVVVLGLPQLEAAASAQREGARPGALGKDVATLGGRIAIIGNADVPDTTTFRPGDEDSPAFVLRRHGALVAMDDRGHIPLGIVGRDTLTSDDTWPFRWRTDYDAIWNAFTDVYDEASLIVVELGDFARLDNLRDRLGPGRLERLRQETVGRVDQWFGRLASWPRAQGATVLLVAPSPPGPALRNNFLLTPFATFSIGSIDPTGESRPGFPPTGAGHSPALATGPTTRRAGIVANVDVAPFVLAALRSPDGANLRIDGPIHAATTSQLARDIPPTVEPPPDAWERVGWLYGRITETHRLRPPVVQTFVTSAIVLFMMWTAWMIYVRGTASPPTPRSLSPWRIPLLLLSGTPLAMLWLPLLPTPAGFLGDESGFASGMRLLILIAIIAAGSHGAQRLLEGRRRPPGHDRERTETALAIILVSLVTALAIVVDVWTGSSFMKSSVLGYDPIVGARYYGIGNEYMGVLVGTALIGTTGLLDRQGQKRPPPWSLASVGIGYAVVCVTVAAPNLGANVGGTVAAVVGCGVTAALLLKGRFTWKTMLAIGLLLGLFVGGAAFLDMATPGPASHLGKTVQLVQEQGRQPLFAIVARKLAMNAKLLRWTIWAQVFVVSLAVSALALYRPSKTIRRLEAGHPHLLHGIRGAVVAALVALIANDSGVVAAATMMIPVTAALMYVILLGLGKDEQAGSVV